VLLELKWDPKINSSRDVAVTVKDGVVTLTPFIPSYWEKDATEKAAKRVNGMPSGNQSPHIPFTVLIMYEDFGTGKRAKKGLDYVAKELGNDFEFSYSMWRLDILQDPKLNVLAAPALAEADLLIISLHGEGHIPAKIRVLIDTWLAEKAYRDRTLVALFESKTSAIRSSVYACLANLARQHGLDFFEQAVSEAEDQEEPSLKLVWVF
jgi:hypothetical protein